ncbi:MAG: hypothetical protein ABI791_06690 [Acidobacteriota bacterium]
MPKRKNDVHSFERINVCPRCEFPMMKHWDELSDDERFIVERLETSLDSSPEQRKKHRYCPRCWFEDRGRNDRLA